MFGERIKAKREEFGLTRKELALRIMSTPQTIKLWELEQAQPTITDFIILAEEFNTSIDWLAGVIDYEDDAEYDEDGEDGEDDEEECDDCDDFLTCKIVPHMQNFMGDNADNAYIHVQLDISSDIDDCVIYSGNVLSVLTAINMLFRSLSKETKVDYYDLVAMMATMYTESECDGLFDSE